MRRNPEAMNFRKVFATSLVALVLSSTAQAGVFTTPRFLAPGESSLGIEPEVVLTSGAGVGFTARYTYGLNELMNVIGVIGTGTGPRKFRAGVASTFDFFPDIEGQPGIGLAFSGIYQRLAESGQFELLATPYVHKVFVTNGSEVEPYFGLPFGMGFSGGQYRALSTVAVGSLFKTAESPFRYGIEFGIAVNNTESAVSAGISYSF